LIVNLPVPALILAVTVAAAIGPSIDVNAGFCTEMVPEQNPPVVFTRTSVTVVFAPNRGMASNANRRMRFIYVAE
jgi:hypothetical protein